MTTAPSLDRVCHRATGARPLKSGGPGWAQRQSFDVLRSRTELVASARQGLVPDGAFGPVAPSGVEPVHPEPGVGVSTSSARDHQLGPSLMWLHVLRCSA